MSVSEGQSPGHLVVTVMTSDPDLESNLEYRISGASTEKFSLDNHGELRLNQHLDRETNSGKFAFQYFNHKDYKNSYFVFLAYIKELNSES